MSKVKVKAAIATIPQLDNMARVGASRKMFSVKSKKAVAKHVVKHKLPYDVVGSVVGVTGATVANWVSDLRTGKFCLSNAIAVSRQK